MSTDDAETLTPKLHFRISGSRSRASRGTSSRDEVGTGLLNRLQRVLLLYRLGCEKIGLVRELQPNNTVRVTEHDLGLNRSLV